MISEKTIEIFESANREYPKENTIYTSEQMKYGYTQRVIELALKEAVSAVERTDLREKTYTRYDRDNLEFCRSQVKKEIESLLNELS
jgi:hypothetical protein